MIIIIKKAMLTCIWKQEANSCPDITSDVLLTLPSTDSLSLHFLLYAFSLNTIKRRLQGNLLEQPMPFIPHTPEDFLPDELQKKFLVVTIWQTLMQLIRESVGLGQLCSDCTPHQRLPDQCFVFWTAGRQVSSTVWRETRTERDTESRAKTDGRTQEGERERERGSISVKQEGEDKKAPLQ